MSNYVGTTYDYTQLVKDYKQQGQDKTLWEQFFTGLTDKYSSLGEQTTSAYETGVEQTKQAYAYDISNAYANYKKQQLGLQMNQQLGEGFKQQVGAELRSAYEDTYSGLKTQEAVSLGELGSEYTSAVTKLSDAYEKEYVEGEEEFTELGTQLRNYEKLLYEYAKKLKLNPLSEDVMYKTTVSDDGTITKELTPEGKLWYNKVLTTPVTNNKGDVLYDNFEKWVLDEELGSATVSYKDREELWATHSKTPDLFEQVTGAQNTKAVRENIFETIKSKNEDTLKAAQRVYGENLDTLSTANMENLLTNISRNNSFIAKIKVKNTMKAGHTITDGYGNSWKIVLIDYSAADYPDYPYESGEYSTVRYHETKSASSGIAADIAKGAGIINKEGDKINTKAYKQGDVVRSGKDYYLITVVDEYQIVFAKVEPNK